MRASSNHICALGFALLGYISAIIRTASKLIGCQILEQPSIPGASYQNDISLWRPAIEGLATPLALERIDSTFIRYTSPSSHVFSSRQGRAPRDARASRRRRFGWSHGKDCQGPSWRSEVEQDCQQGELSWLLFIASVRLSDVLLTIFLSGLPTPSTTSSTTPTPLSEPAMLSPLSPAGRLPNISATSSSTLLLPTVPPLRSAHPCQVWRKG